MLSSGTRIGSTRIINWLSEGSCGQSYHCTGTENSIKGEEFYIKLITRDVSERKGFGDYFLQETQAIEQLEGIGIWPIENSGVTKWKHWIRYPWLDGEECEIEIIEDEDSRVEIRKLRSLDDLCRFKSEEINPEQLLNLMITFHQGLYKAHLSGVCHGNLKPTNILVKKNDQNKWDCFITEFGVYRLNLFTPHGLSEEEKKDVFVINSDAQSSLQESENFRPKGVNNQMMPEENWDLYAAGKIVKWIIEQSKLHTGAKYSWEDWETWISRATSQDSESRFSSCAHSMDALPGVGDISRFGVKIEDESEKNQVDLEQLRLEREQKFKLNEKILSLRMRRGMTFLVGSIILSFYLIYSIYLFFLPTPWSEYSLKGLSDSYQLAAGIFTGQAWGIVPANYDEEGDGGQDVVGNWTKENGLYKLKFKRFKKSREQESGKKLWQFIGEGKTSDEDYFIWEDFLKYDRGSDAFYLIKRKDSKNIYIPGSRSDGLPRLYPEGRFKSSAGEIVKSDLIFNKKEEDGIRWSLFFAIGFLLASFIYHQELKKLVSTNEMVE